MRSCRRSKGTRLLLRKTTFCRLQLSHPTSLPSLPLPRETVSSSPTSETRRAVSAFSKLPGADTSHQLGSKSKHQGRTEVKIHGDSQRVSFSYLLLNLLFLSTPRPIPAPSPAREIRVKFTRGVDFSWQTQALLALQEASEAFYFVSSRMPVSSPYTPATSRSPLRMLSWPRGSGAFKGTSGLWAPTRISGGHQRPSLWLGPDPWGTRWCLHLLSLNRVCELLS